MTRFAVDPEGGQRHYRQVGRSPYEPPRSEIDVPNDVAPTVGYLVGGLLQLGLAAFLILRSVLAEPRDVSIVGLFLAFLGTRTIVKYRARTRNARRTR